jgi:hypothetical protein
VHIYTDATSFFRLSKYHAGDGRIERIGRVSPEYFKVVLDALKENNRGTLAYLKEGSVYVPSLQYLVAPDETDFVPGLIPYGHIDEYDRALLLRDLANPDLTIDGDRVCTDYIHSLRDAQKEGYLGYLRGRERDRTVAKIEADLNRRGRHTAMGSRTLPNITVSFDAAKSAPSEAVAIRPDERQSIKPDRDIVGEPRGLESLRDAFHERASACKIVLPKHLWKGRYLMLKINSLAADDGIERGGTAYRPCAVWNAYTDKNTGELAGFDLHPVTREEAHLFKFKMPVHPLKTDSQREGVLVADCIIRVPLSRDYFHENAASNFFELTPEKIERFLSKKAVMSEMGAVPHIIGLETIPDNWEEVELQPTPSFQQFQKWAQKGQARFDGNLYNPSKNAGRALMR